MATVSTETIAAFESLSLPVRMRVAARVLMETSARNSGLPPNESCGPWTAKALRQVADTFEAEDIAFDEKWVTIRSLVAESLYTNGWKKVTSQAVDAVTHELLGHFEIQLKAES